MMKKLRSQAEILNDLVTEITGSELKALDLKDIFSEIKGDRPIWLLGAGKAAVRMAQQAEAYFGDRLKDGLIITDQNAGKLKYTQVFTGTHPYPHEDSVSASYELIHFAQKIPETDPVLFCLSGGASSLFCIPDGDIETEDLRNAYKLLLNSGASIHEINIVRKHISRSSGGRLGRLLADHQLHSVIISDVPGDDPQSIGSGPTVPDSSTFEDAFHILKQYGLWTDMAHSVRIHISKGMTGYIEDTPKPVQNEWKKHHVEVIPAAKQLAAAVKIWLEKLGFNVKTLTKAYDTELSKLSKKICSEAITVLNKRSEIHTPAALIYFGESRLNVKNGGKGGRNQHLALMAALTIEGQHPISLMSYATDGVDGPTDSAGAIVNSMTTLNARKQNLKPEEYLHSFNSYDFHEKMGTHIITGSTGRNMMDLQVVLINVPS